MGCANKAGLVPLILSAYQLIVKFLLILWGKKKKLFLNPVCNEWGMLLSAVLSYVLCVE